MRTLFIIPLVLMSLVSFPSWGLTMDDLVKREGLYYKKFTDVPFTGKITGNIVGTLENGYWDGLYEKYIEGKIYWRGKYIKGKKEGLWVQYFESGDVSSKGNYLDGNREGFWIGYFGHGQLHSKGNYKNGKKDGFWIEYWENGLVFSKGNYKNGLRKGEWLQQDRFGNINSVETGTFKNGQKVSE